jgi:hypothetical protein
LLALALYPPAWYRRDLRLVGGAEVLFFLVFTLGLFLFTAANQFSRMQFNTGIRHLVPVAPFVFLIAAGLLRRLPRGLAAAVGVVAVYWSWCLAMYRDVELGWGILESLRHITFEGVRLPWLMTLHNMGYLQSLSPLPFLLLAGGIVWAIWGFYGVAQTLNPVRVWMQNGWTRAHLGTLSAKSGEEKTTYE